MSVYDLCEACEVGDAAKVEGLLKQVKDVNETDESGFTALHFAAMKGHANVIPMLLKAGAKHSTPCFDSEQMPLHMALSNKKFDCAKLLIEAGAELNTLNNTGMYGAPIHYAIFGENLELVRLLIKMKCDINLPDYNKGYTPVMLATSSRAVEMLAEMIKAGADVNLADWEGTTPMHWAAYNGYGECVKMLADAKADVSLKDENEKTALDLATEAKDTNIMAFLTECAGGKIPAKAPEGKARTVVIKPMVVPLEACGEGCAPPE